tara:strand:+ start:854 stop:1183 length:330 start_codon:yes stop_codon:yes gene_type:complete
MEIRDGDVVARIMKNGQDSCVINVMQRIMMKNSTSVQDRAEHPRHISILDLNVTLFVYQILIHKTKYVKKYLLVVVVVMRVTAMVPALELVNVNVMMGGIPVSGENNAQ